MNKIFVCIVILLLAVLSLLFFIPEVDTYDIIEGLGGRGRGRRGRGGRGGGRRGGRHHHSGRRWYGGNIGYGYRRPQFRQNYPRYVPWWTSSYWFVDDCKDGCTNIGNDAWGCQYPGNGPNDCVFANDCYGCGI
tara:strand:- start:810 stop:1211 length:402 start_codon:yes stop_codon:yes gene_type:complete